MFYPYKDLTTQVTYDSCFAVAGTDKFEEFNNQFVLGIDLGQSFFQHAINFVQDMLEGLWANEPYGTTNVCHYFQNFRIYIGDNSDWSKNAECAGGPFMTLDADSDGWY